MKILISVSYYAPHISGLTNSVKNLSELLLTGGFKVKVLTTQHKKSLPRRQRLNGIDIIRVPYLFKLHKGFFMPGFIFEAFYQVKNSDQVIINLPQVEGAMIAILGKLLRKKVHSIYACEVKVGTDVTSKIIEKILDFSNKLCLALSNTIITLTQDFSQNSKILSKLSKNIDLIYPVIKFPVINNDTEKHVQYKFGNKRKYSIGYIGRIAKEKGIEFLLESIPYLEKKIGSDFVIVLAGPMEVIGEKNYIEKIDKLINKYQKNIIRLGEFKPGELGNVYKLMDVVVIPSLDTTEAFGMVQVESMYCGTPAVVTNLPGVREIAKKTQMGEIAMIGDAADLSEKIIKVIKNRNKYIKDKVFIENLFSHKKILGQYKKILT